MTSYFLLPVYLAWLSVLGRGGAQDAINCSAVPADLYYIGSSFYPDFLAHFRTPDCYTTNAGFSVNSFVGCPLTCTCWHQCYGYYSDVTYTNDGCMVTFMSNNTAQACSTPVPDSLLPQYCVNIPFDLSANQSSDYTNLTCPTIVSSCGSTCTGWSSLIPDPSDRCQSNWTFWSIQNMTMTTKATSRSLAIQKCCSLKLVALLMMLVAELT
jgi:hypothetical protein